MKRVGVTRAGVRSTDTADSELASRGDTKMCGIIGMIRKHAFTSKDVLTRLQRLEYRGYDSYGYWNGKTLTRHTGRIVVTDDGQPTNCAISHTRWATHGPVTEENAHPHRAGAVTIVHNGIIENWRALRRELEAAGAHFRSDTDSEVLAHFIQHHLAAGAGMPDILRRVCDEFTGTFAALVMVAGDDALYALKRDSPLALGVLPDGFILASDIYGFSDVTQRALFFENDEYAVITPEAYTIFHKGTTVSRPPRGFHWTTQRETKQSFPHFMLKEIHEAPSAAARLISSLAGDQRDAFERLVDAVRSASKVVFTAAGTAYHASLLGASLLHQCGLQAQAVIASEFETFVTLDENTLVIAVSQSGETMDVIEALKYARARGATLAAIVNVPYSTIERLASLSLSIRAGQEVAVASTKAFTNQALLLLALAGSFGHQQDVQSIPEKLRLVLDLEPKIRSLAATLHQHHDLYVLGRRLGYPVAREIALKIKEVSYLHAEGMMGGELKHGTIALISEGTPVLSLIYDDDTRMRGNTQEVRARGAKVVVIGTRPGADLLVPAANEAEFMLLVATVGQLLAYYIARERGLPIDKPRNLAKSVTVL